MRGLRPHAATAALGAVLLLATAAAAAAATPAAAGDSSSAPVYLCSAALCSTEDEWQQQQQRRPRDVTLPLLCRALDPAVAGGGPLVRQRLGESSMPRCDGINGIGTSTCW